MLVRLMIVVCMAAAGTIVGAADYPSLLASAMEAPEPTPMPIVHRGAAIDEPQPDAELEAGRARWNELLAQAQQAPGHVGPTFAGKRSATHARAHTAPKRSARARAAARSSSIRGLFQRPSIFEQSSFGGSRSSRSAPGARPGLGSHSRFGFHSRPSGGRIIRRSSR